MKIQGIIHQQICQLKWHILACFGLIMVLPIEEALVNLKDGFGFHSGPMVIVSAMFAPLLAGLIACANVQGDLNDKLYFFWRSKPANVKLLITIKFFTGLIVSLVILACPIAFGIISGGFTAEYLGESEIIYFLPFSVLLTITLYSLCFGCNVLVRSTARAWLVGLLLTGFLLVLPFILPLGYRDFVSDIMSGMMKTYLVIMLVASVTAFIFSLFASQHDWHLRTNLKGLLWVVAGLVFVLLMLFSSQVANIKVLQEKEIESSHWWPSIRHSIDNVGEKIIFQGRSFINIDNDTISLIDISGEHDYIIFNWPPKIEGYHIMRYPRYGMLYKNVGDDVYSFVIHTYLRTEGQGRFSKTFFEKAYLRSYKHTDKSRLVCELDISNCLTNFKRYFIMAMRLIDNKLVAFVNNNYVVVDTTEPGELKLIDTKLDAIKIRGRYYRDRQKEFAIPLLPVEEFGMEDRIKLSIDWIYRRYDMYEASIVDIHDGKFAFFSVDEDDIARFDVTHWDKEKIYCRFSASRPYTILEGATGASIRWSTKFVKNGKLYCYNDNTLMVFDIRSNRRIRKLGHFVRMDYEIQDIAVLEDGNILLCVRWNHEFIPDRYKENKYYLYLLKNPE